MKYLQFNPFIYPLQRQKNIRHLSWMKRFLERLLQISNSPVRLANVINVLQSAVGNEDQTYLIITKSDLTGPIEQADNERDNTYSGLRSMADAKKRIGTAEEKGAAERVLERMSYHKVDLGGRYEDESEKIAQVVQDLKSGSLATDIATLGLTAIVNLLEQQNQQVVTLMMQRQADRSTQESQAMAKARALTDAAYEDVALVLNAFAITEFDGQSSPYDAIIRIINSDMTYYQQHVFTTDSGSSDGSQQGGATNSGNSGTTEPGGTEQGGTTDSGNSGTTEPGGTGTITPGTGGSNENDNENENGGTGSGDDNGGGNGGSGMDQN